MSLTVHLTPSPRADPIASSTRCWFEDDAVYWFFYPSFEALQQATGQMIDLCDGAQFGGPALNDLDRCLADVRRRAAELPDEWDQVVGWNVGSRVAPVDPPTPVYKRGRKADLTARVDAFAAAVVEARRDGLWITCMGD